jgi:hypothetical protein
MECVPAVWAAWLEFTGRCPRATAGGQSGVLAVAEAVGGPSERPVPGNQGGIAEH